MTDESCSFSPGWVSELADLAVADDASVAALDSVFGDFRRVFVLNPEKRRALWDSIIARSPEPSSPRKTG